MMIKPIFLVLLVTMSSLAGCLGSVLPPSMDDSEARDSLVIAYEVKDDYENPDVNPQVLSDFLSAELDMDVTLYPIASEGAIIEALRFGHADIAFMDGAAAWMGWQQYGLGVLVADQKEDGRTYYEANAWVLNNSEMAEAYLDGDDSTDPFTLLQGKTSCHTGWLKSAGMLLPMGYLIGNGYATVQGNSDDIASLRDTITGFFNENASIPESGTPYYSYGGAIKCLSDGTGDVAFAKDSTVAKYCGNENASSNEDWCLGMERYVKLPAFGKAPSHPIMYNPSKMDSTKAAKITEALLSLNDSPKGQEILANVLNTPGLVETNTEDHLGSYGELVQNVPGISTYFNDKYGIKT
ncbi:MAG: phosphate/phosphite/phosphonate ABC transporter substrate-binding protein [Candidatus Poseidoniales archaeon]|jgi:ABC-type phosphate/phosphonate transport system substrate-binding protein